MRSNNITKKVGIMVMDNEANYELSLEFMHSILSKNLDILDVHWVCLVLNSEDKKSYVNSLCCKG
jgi:predicted phosphoadenosine phosphosulfate sulfurtransferase